MENITNVRVGRIADDSLYLKPFRVDYTQNGREKSRNLLQVHDSVSIILFNASRNALLFVKQFRPAVYYSKVSDDSASHGQEINFEKYPAEIGVTVELCSGLVDKNLPLADIAREEIYEEVGYTVTNDRLEEIMSYHIAVEYSGAHQTLFYCEVNDSDKSTDGGGVDDELIEVVEYTLDEAKQMLQLGNNVNSRTPNFILGILWFLANKAPKILSKS